MNTFIRALAVTALPLLGHVAPAQAQSTTTPMPFPECVSRLEQMSAEFGTKPVVMVDLPATRMVRFTLRESTVTATCNGPDRRLVVTHVPLPKK